jgi:hypothetical protein
MIFSPRRLPHEYKLHGTSKIQHGHAAVIEIPDVPGSVPAHPLREWWCATDLDAVSSSDPPVIVADA